MVKHLVVVTGNLGTGKTTLVERISARFNWHTVYESVIDNPYLADFYADMRTWSFYLQIYFLGHRAKQHLEAAGMCQSVIMDRSIYEDAKVFAKALHYLGNITDRDYAAYRQIFDVVVRTLPHPDLLIYLKAPPKVLIRRIQKRGLEFDYRGITEGYLALIDSYYEKWIQAFDLCPILAINTEKLDYINDVKCLEVIIKNVSHMLEKETVR